MSKGKEKRGQGEEEDSDITAYMRTTYQGKLKGSTNEIKRIAEERNQLESELLSGKYDVRYKSFLKLLILYLHMATTASPMFQEVAKNVYNETLYDYKGISKKDFSPSIIQRVANRRRIHMNYQTACRYANTMKVLEKIDALKHRLENALMMAYDSSRKLKRLALTDQ